MPFSAFAIIELSGHIIDSLTLAKVIDKIQSMECRYQINDIQIGQRKSDFSHAQISLWAKDKESLEAVLDELKPYGVLPLQETSSHLEPCPNDGVPPDGAYIRRNPPTEIFYEGRWIPVSREGFDQVIMIDPETRTARFREISSVKQGDRVVVGKAGVRILPTLGEAFNAELVTG